MAFKYLSLKEHPSLSEQNKSYEDEWFPEFILADHVWNDSWPYMINDFAEYQLIILDESGALMGMLNTVPFRWDGTSEDLPGFHDLLKRSINEHQAGIEPNTFSAMQAMTTPDAKGKGISAEIDKASHQLAVSKGFAWSVSPIRPTLKDQYPNFSLEDYANWKNDAGEPFDPWVRVQDRRGGERLKIQEASTVIEGSVTDWQNWTKMSFPVTGNYVVAGAHTLVHIDREQDRGRYEEPHIWYRYKHT